MPRADAIELFIMLFVNPEFERVARTGVFRAPIVRAVFSLSPLKLCVLDCE